MEELSTEEPKSFKLDRRSKFASKLKSLISRRLLHFFPDYSDNVLAEYITVLVCNGKNQNQARDDLEAFLGGKTEEFVSWLWKLISKNETQLSDSVVSDRKVKALHSSCNTDSDKGNGNKASDDHQSQANSDSVNLMEDECEEKCRSSRQASKTDNVEPPKDCHPPVPKVMTNSPFQSDVPSKEAETLDTSTKVLLSVTKYQIEQVDDFGKHLRCTDSPTASLAQAPALVATPAHCNQLSDKNPASILGRCPASILGRLPASLPKSCPGSGSHSSHIIKKPECQQMHYAKNALKRTSQLLPVAPSSYIKKPCIDKPQKSVWDRLGKQNHDTPSRSQIAGFCEIDRTRCDREHINKDSPLISETAKQIGQVSSSLPLPRIEGNRTSGPNHIVVANSKVPSAGRIERKRQYGKIGGHTDADVVMEKRADNHVRQTCQSHKISEQVNDVKLRLCQIEKEMVKLRRTQILMEKDGNANLLTKSSVMKATKDESRTVLVTNVHVEATKETLSRYFQKCGAVVDVILANNMPSEQGRSAYIIFQNKEAAERALGFTGASFYSRTIKVSKKGENPSTTTLPAQIAGKKLQVSRLESNRASEGLSFSGSHLNWSLSSVQSQFQTSACVQTKMAAESAC